MYKLFVFFTVVLLRVRHGDPIRLDIHLCEAEMAARMINLDATWYNPWDKHFLREQILTGLVRRQQNGHTTQGRCHRCDHH